MTKPAVMLGCVYPFRVFSVLRANPRLLRYIVIPVFINIVVGATIYTGLLLAGLRVIEWFVDWLPAWAYIMGTIVRLVLIVGLFIATGFLLLRFGVVLGSPWYGTLSEELECIVTGERQSVSASSLSRLVREIGRSLSFEAKKLLLFVGIGGPLLLLNVIPGVGPFLAGAGATSMAVLIVCLDFLDPPLERRRLGFLKKLRMIQRSYPASAGFGLVCLGLVSVPLLNLFAIPICVAAGTLFFCRHILPELDLTQGHDAESLHGG